MEFSVLKFAVLATIVDLSNVIIHLISQSYYVVADAFDFPIAQNPTEIAANHNFDVIIEKHKIFAGFLVLNNHQILII